MGKGFILERKFLGFINSNSTGKVEGRNVLNAENTDEIIGVYTGQQFGVNFWLLIINCLCGCENKFFFLF